MTNGWRIGSGETHLLQAPDLLGFLYGSLVRLLRFGFSLNAGPAFLCG